MFLKNSMFNEFESSIIHPYLTQHIVYNSISLEKDNTVTYIIYNIWFLFVFSYLK